MRELVDIDAARLEVHHHEPARPATDRPLVLLHPWFGCWQFWDRTVAALPELETYAVNLYSLGNGGNWQRFASPQGLSNAVRSMLDRLRIDRCHLMGNSMGGIASQHLASMDPGWIDKLILVGTGARSLGVKPEFRQMLDQWISDGENQSLTEHLVDALLAHRPADPKEFKIYVDMVTEANKAFMGAVLSNAFQLDLRPKLPSITAATLVIRGSLDAARTQTHVDEILAGIPGSRSAEVPDGGHSPQVDSPERFVKLVRDFLIRSNVDR